jgi:hypothetical protein
VDSVVRISRVRRIVENNLVSNVHEIVLFWVCSCNVMIESSGASSITSKKKINKYCAFIHHNFPISTGQKMFGTILVV